jgi:hypothetical protein
MPLPSGVTYVTVLSVDAFDEQTNKPTVCSLLFDVNGVEYTRSMNIGTGFLQQLTEEVIRIKRAPVWTLAAQTIVNNKIA